MSVRRFWRRSGEDRELAQEMEVSPRGRDG